MRIQTGRRIRVGHVRRRTAVHRSKRCGMRRAGEGQRSPAAPRRPLVDAQPPYQTMIRLTANRSRDVYRRCSNCGLPRPTVNEYAARDPLLPWLPWTRCWSHSASMCRAMASGAAERLVGSQPNFSIDVDRITVRLGGPEMLDDNGAMWTRVQSRRLPSRCSLCGRWHADDESCGLAAARAVPA